MAAEMILEIARRHGIPQWWVEAIAIEYTDCRHLAAGNEIWEFDFKKVRPQDLEEALRSNRVVVFGRLLHNVRQEVWAARATFRMISNVPAPLVEEMDDVFAEGPVAEYSFPWIGNPIEGWDPKLGFSTHFQVLDDDGFWQWRIAEFVEVEGRSYGKWASSEVDLDSLDQVHERLAQLRNPVIRPGEPEHAGFKRRVEEFYRWLDQTRRPILKRLEELHWQKRAASPPSKAVSGSPPLLSHFERFTVRDHEINTKLLAEPIFFRACATYAHDAWELHASLRQASDVVEHLDRSYEKRASAIVFGAAALEAFINGVGVDSHAKLWGSVERQLGLIAKWKLLLTLAGKEDAFDAGRQPYKALHKLVSARNSLSHFKHRYRPVSRVGGRVMTSVDLEMGAEFVRDMPDRIRELIDEFCKLAGRPAPGWLRPGPGWMQ